MNQMIYQPQHLQARFNNAASNDRLHPIYREVAERLCDRLEDTKRTYPLALELGTGSGSIAQSFPASKRPESLLTLDFSHDALQKAEGYDLRLQANAEMPLPFAPRTFDLVLTNLMLPWANNPTRVLAQAGQALKDDGLFLATTLGDQTFYEFQHVFGAMRAKFPHMNPMPDVQTVGSILQQVGFALPVIDRDMITLEYNSFSDILADLKAVGPTNLHPERKRGLTTKAFWAEVEQKYTEMFAKPNAKLPLTLEVIYLHGWRPHHSQQKPLPRGSAQVDLSEVLGKM